MTALRGRIGIARRVHLLDQVDRPEFGAWGSSACGKWAGRVELVEEGAAVTCRDCAGLDPSKVETRTVSAEKHDPERPMF